MEISLDEQIAYMEREIRFMEGEGIYEDDLPIAKAIMESLNRLKGLEK